MAEQEKQAAEEEISETGGDVSESGEESTEPVGEGQKEPVGQKSDSEGEQAAGDVEDSNEETVESEEDTSEENQKTWAEKRAEKKQAKLNKKEEAFKEQIAQLEDRVKRQMAEFENFRKRTDREKQTMFEMGAKSVIEKVLPIVDNFERGLSTVPEENKEDPFVDGMNRVYKQLLTELENIGVKPIEAVGQEFDPNLHNAVMQVASEEYESGVVAQELQKGYTYRESVVRHSMVAVVE